MKKTMLALTILNVAISASTLGAVLLGAKKVHEEMERGKKKANDAIRAAKFALEGMELD